MSVLANRRTSQVFFLIVEGKKTINEIAHAMKVSPPGIVEQIHRLEKIGFVLRAEKKGKFQPYEIDWQEVAIKCSESFPELNDVVAIYADREHGVEDVNSRKLFLHIKDRLAHNNSFVRLIQRYFESVVEESPNEDYLKDITILQAIGAFEVGILRIFPMTRLAKAEAAVKELHGLLREWYASANQTDPISRAALKDALGDIGLWQES